MQAAQGTFISSTFWTERIGPTAALAALAVMEEEDAPARIYEIGLRVQEMWKEIGHSVGLKVLPVGVPSLSTFSIEGFDALCTKTFITQEMLRKGFIAGAALYASIAHEAPVLDQYRSELEKVFARIATLNSSEGILDLLEAGPSQAGFQRLA